MAEPKPNPKPTPESKSRSKSPPVVLFWGEDEFLLRLAAHEELAARAVRALALRRQDLAKWLLDRARKRGLRLASSATMELTAILGEDPATLDQALEQLASAFPGKSVGPPEVRSQFQGLGEKQVWDLCDQAFAGRLPQALVVL